MCVCGRERERERERERANKRDRDQREQIRETETIWILDILSQKKKDLVVTIKSHNIFITSELSKQNLNMINVPSLTNMTFSFFPISPFTYFWKTWLLFTSIPDLASPIYFWLLAYFYLYHSLENF